MQSYVDQMAKVRVPAGVQTTIDLGAVSQLPGVSGESEANDEVRAQRTRLVEQVTARALDALVAMRRDEGRVLHDALVQNCESIRAQLAEVGRRAPSVIEEYHERLKTRVERTVQRSAYELRLNSDLKIDWNYEGSEKQSVRKSEPTGGFFNAAVSALFGILPLDSQL